MSNTIPVRPADTTADAERVQVMLLQAASVARRLHTALSLSATVISAARRALTRLQPSMSSHERDLRFVELHYGRDIAAGLRLELARRAQAARLDRSGNPARPLLHRRFPVEDDLAEIPT